MTLTEIIESWVHDAERMSHGRAQSVVVTEELFASLVAEQSTPTPSVAGVWVLTAATEAPANGNLPTFEEMVEVAGPDRVSIYVADAGGATARPLGLDPAMPVVFVPVPPDSLRTRPQLEMYNRLRWYGLAPIEALAGSQV